MICLLLFITHNQNQMVPIQFFLNQRRMPIHIIVIRTPELSTIPSVLDVIEP